MRVFDNKEFQRLLKEYNSISKSHEQLVKRFMKDIKNGIRENYKPSEIQGFYSVLDTLMGVASSNLTAFNWYVMESLGENNPNVKIDDPGTWSFTDDQRQRLMALTAEIKVILDEGIRK